MIVERKIEVVIVQEREGKVCGLRGGRLFYLRNSGDRPWACVVVYNDRIGTVQIAGLCSDHNVCVELLLPDGRRLYVCSMYWQPPR